MAELQEKEPTEFHDFTPVGVRRAGLLRPRHRRGRAGSETIPPGVRGQRPKMDVAMIA
jgi:hypothetical protein